MLHFAPHGDGKGFSLYDHGLMSESCFKAIKGHSTKYVLLKGEGDTQCRANNCYYKTKKSDVPKNQLLNVYEFPE